MNEDKIKQKVQFWIVSASVVLMAGKFTAFLLTNSVGILTDAMESIVNVTAGFITLYTLHIAAKPSDREHPFGHGKAELISASFEGILIFLAGCFIIFEGVRRLFEPTMPQKLDIGIIIIAAAGVANYILGWYSIRVGKRYDSMALEAGGKHLQSDTYSTIGLVAGLILLYVTRLPWIDSALALIYGSIIGWTGISVLRKTVGGLIDQADIPMLEELLDAVNKNREPDWIDIHNLRMIKYGSYLYIDCDVTLPWYYNIKEGHDATERLRHTILDRLSRPIILSVHSDSCDERHCRHCGVQNCPSRFKPFVSPSVLTFSEITENDEQRAKRLAIINR